MLDAGCQMFDDGCLILMQPVTFCLDAKSNQKNQDLDLFAKK